MASQGVFLLLAVAWVGSVPLPECLDLLKPLALEDHRLIIGKWFSIMAASENGRLHSALTTVMGSSVELTPTALNCRVMTVRWSDKTEDGKCVEGSSQATISGGPTCTILKFTTGSASCSGQLFQTCPDCLLWSDVTTRGESTGRNLIMFRKTAVLEPPHLQSFRKQAECLNFPQRYHIYDGVTELCAENADCEALLSPPVIKDHSPIYGKWYLIIGASDNMLFHTSLTPVKSGWIDIEPTGDATMLTLRWGERTFGTCRYGSTKVTITDNPTSCLQFTSFSTKREGYYLQPCSDCLLWIDKANENGQTGQNIDMYRRIPKLESFHLKIFQKHSACSNFPPIYNSYDGVTEVCRDNQDLEACDDLFKPLVLTNSNPISGKWIYVIGASDQINTLNSLEKLKSSWIDVSLSSNDTELYLHWGEHINGKCSHGTAAGVIRNLASQDSSIEFVNTSHKHYRNGSFFQPCPDCLIWRDTYSVGSITTRLLFLFRRTAQMDTFHLQMFRKHASCLTFPQTHNSYDGVTELCPDERPK